MALIKCPECGHEISSEAKNCPNCGKQLRTFWDRQPWEKRLIEDRKLGNIVISIIDFFIISLGIIGSINLATKHVRYDMMGYNTHSTLDDIMTFFGTLAKACV